MEDIGKFANDIQRLLAQVEFYKKQNQLFQNQLLIFNIVFGSPTGMQHPDMNNIDWEKIKIGCGYSSSSVTDNSGKVIRDWKNIPNLELK